MSEETNVGGGAAMPQPMPPCPNGRMYTVKPGDSMFTIARQFNIPLATLIAANPQIADPNMIFPGQMICVPGAAAPPMACPGGFTYTVQAGDSLYTIATRFGVPLSSLEAANPQIGNPDLIFPGQVICIPAAAQPPVTCPNGMLYTVRPGDTMFDIATRFGVTLQALLAANPQVADPNKIFAGQTLCVPAMAAGPVPPPVVISPVVSPPVAPPVAAPPAAPPMAPCPAAPLPEAPVLPPVMMPAAPCVPAVPPVPLPQPYPMPMPAMPCPGMAPIAIEPVKERRHHKHGRHRREWFCPMLAVEPLERRRRH